METDNLIISLLENNENIQSFCRVCLGKKMEGLISLFDAFGAAPLRDKVMLCARVQIHTGDGLPSKICYDCSERLDVAHTFRAQCEQSDVVLRKLLTNKLLTKIPELDELSNQDSIKEELITNDLTIKVEFDGRHLQEYTGELNGISAAAFPAINSQNALHSERSECRNLFLVKPSAVESRKEDKKSQGETRDRVYLEKADKKSRAEPRKEVCTRLEDKKCEIEARILVSAGLEGERAELEPRREEEIVGTDASEQVQCPECSVQLCNKSILEFHLQTTHRDSQESKGGLRRFQCGECPYTTNRSQHFTYHKRTHTGEKPYKCDICDKCFALKGTLNDHVRLHYDKMYFTCSVCGKQFKTRNKYEKHKNVHVTEKKFVCSICNQGCKSKVTFNFHMKRHLNIKNYSCDVCGMTFVTNNQLINHSVKHKELKDFACNICKFKTKSNKYLKIHLKRHSGVLGFNCSYCSLGFFTRGELAIHTRTHTKEKKYSCPDCNTKFVQSSTVNRHMLKIHGKIYRHNDTVDRRVIK